MKISIKPITKKPWFGPRKLGWGFAPATWEGWVSMMILFVIVLYLIVTKTTDPYLVFYILGLVGIFTIFCFLTGSKPGYKPLDKK